MKRADGNEPMGSERAIGVRPVGRAKKRMRLGRRGPHQTPAVSLAQRNQPCEKAPAPPPRQGIDRHSTLKKFRPREVRYYGGVRRCVWGRIGCGRHGEMSVNRSVCASSTKRDGFPIGGGLPRHGLGMCHPSPRSVCHLSRRFIPVSCRAGSGSCTACQREITSSTRGVFSVTAALPQWLLSATKDLSEFNLCAHRVLAPRLGAPPSGANTRAS
jgi:hypothetical protein